MHFEEFGVSHYNPRIFKTKPRHVRPHTVGLEHVTDDNILCVSPVLLTPQSFVGCANPHSQKGTTKATKHTKSITEMIAGKSLATEVTEFTEKFSQP